MTKKRPPKAPKELFSLNLRHDLLEALKLESGNRPMRLIDDILTKAVRAPFPDNPPKYPEETTRQKYAIRITAATLAAVRQQATASYRPIGNYIELLLVDYLEKHGKLKPCQTPPPSPSTTAGDKSP